MLLSGFAQRQQKYNLKVTRTYYFMKAMFRNFNQSVFRYYIILNNLSQQSFCPHKNYVYLENIYFKTSGS